LIVEALWGRPKGQQRQSEDILQDDSISNKNDMEVPVGDSVAILTSRLAGQVVIELENYDVLLPHPFLVEPPMRWIMPHFVRLVDEVWVHNVHRH